MKTPRWLANSAMGIVAGGVAMTAALVLPASASAATTASKTEKSFVTTVYQGCLGTIELGKLTPSRALTGHIIGHGVNLTADCKAYNETLKSIASKDGIALPSKPTAADQKSLAEIAKLPKGQAFEDAFVGFDISTTARAVIARNAVAKTPMTANTKLFVESTRAAFDDHFSHMSDMAVTSGIKIPSLINTGEGGSVPSPRPVVLPLLLVLLGATLTAGSMVAVRAARR